MIQIHGSKTLLFLEAQAKFVEEEAKLFSSSLLKLFLQVGGIGRAGWHGRSGRIGSTYALRLWSGWQAAAEADSETRKKTFYLILAKAGMQIKE